MSPGTLGSWSPAPVPHPKIPALGEATPSLPLHGPAWIPQRWNGRGWEAGVPPAFCGGVRDSHWLDLPLSVASSLPSPPLSPSKLMRGM